MILLSVLILAFLVEVSSQQNFNFTDTGEWRVRGADVESDRDEIPHIQGQEPQLRGATPCQRSGVEVERRYPTSKVRISGCALLEQP